LARVHTAAPTLIKARAHPPPLLPLLQTFLLEGEFPVLDLLGIMYGHFFYHLQQTGQFKAPGFLTRWYELSDDAIATYLRAQYAAVGDAVGI